MSEGSVFCSRCGAQVAPASGPPVEEEVSQKSRIAVTLLSCPVLYVGLFGAHRFYMGKIKTAVIMLLMGLAPLLCGFGAGVVVFTSFFDEGDPPPPLFFVFWGLGFLSYLGVFVWSLIDFITAVTGNFKDKLGKPIKKW